MSGKNDILTLRRYLKRQHVFTLCTVERTDCENLDMWCANCFYATDPDDFSLYFLTESTTLHGAMMIKNPHVAGTISTQNSIIAKIQGIQFKGEVLALEGEEEKAARKRYCHHFPIALAAKTPIWQLRLDKIKMVNNLLGFGHKIYWDRKESE